MDMVTENNSWKECDWEGHNAILPFISSLVLLSLISSSSCNTVNVVFGCFLGCWDQEKSLERVLSIAITSL